MTDNNPSKMPSFDPSIFAEAAKRLSDGLSKEYLEKLAILMKADEDDPILAAAVVMGAFSTIVGKVPEDIEKLLENFRQTPGSKVSLEALEIRLGSLNNRYEEVSKDLASFREELRLTRRDVKSFEETLAKVAKSRAQQLASGDVALKQNSAMRKWLIVLSVMQFLAIIVHLYRW